MGSEVEPWQSRLLRPEGQVQREAPQDPPLHTPEDVDGHASIYKKMVVGQSYMKCK